MNDQGEKAAPVSEDAEPTTDVAESSSVLTTEPAPALAPTPAPATATASGETTMPNAAGGELALNFKVRSSSEKTHAIAMVPSATVLQLKALLGEDQYEGIPVERQRLIYSGRVLKNDDTLATYNIKPGNTIHLVRSAASNQAAGSSQPGASATSATRSPVPPNMAAGTANNLLAGLTGARYAGHVHLPSRDMFGPDGGLGPPAEPEEMMRRLQDPAYRQTLNEFLDNPDFVNMLIEMNPMLRNNPNARDMFRMPFIRNMLTSPETFNALRGFHAPGAGARAFPAPGATDTTPIGAPATDPNAPSTTSGTPASPGGIPILLQFMNATRAGGAGGAGASNPFLPLFHALQGMPPGAQADLIGTGNALAGNAQAGGLPVDLPATLRPENRQALTQLLSNLAGMPPTQPGNANFGVPPNLATYSAFQQWMASPAAAAPIDNRPPQERFETQLRQLNEMGFYDFERNMTALQRSGGNVQGAIDYLLGG